MADIFYLDVFYTTYDYGDIYEDVTGHLWEMTECKPVEGTKHNNYKYEYQGEKENDGSEEETWSPPKGGAA